jgi:hypothetical protein
MPRVPRFLPAVAVFLTGCTFVLGVGAVAFVVGPSTAAAASQDLPPAKKAALAKLFGDALEPFGLRVSRGLLQNDSTYKPDPNGTHLALYVTPTSSSYGTADFVENFAEITRVFVPMVFKRWKGLQSFDICQEPFDDPRDDPPPVTQIFVSRDALDRVGNWKRATLIELLAAVPKDRRQRGADYYVYFNSEIRQDPRFQASADAAGYDTYRLDR